MKQSQSIIKKTETRVKVTCCNMFGGEDKQRKSRNSSLLAERNNTMDLKLSAYRNTVFTQDFECSLHSTTMQHHSCVVSEVSFHT